MIKKKVASMPALVLCLSMFSAAAVNAQPTAGPAWQTGGVSEHHQMMYEMMKDMSQEMSKMTERMSGGEITPEQRKQMSQRMKRMSRMMDRMAGLESRPAMREPEMKKQMAQMRRQMDEMKQDPSMKSPAK